MLSHNVDFKGARDVFHVRSLSYINKNFADIDIKERFDIEMADYPLKTIYNDFL